MPPTLVGTYMVKSPFSAEKDLSISEALHIMTNRNIRHLPIIDHGKLIGLVSERNLREVVSLPISDQLKVSDVMRTDVFVARRTSPLKNVVSIMEREKIGSVVIVNDQFECVGIFTTIDALELLRDLLNEEEDSTLALLEDYADFWEEKAPA